MSQDPALDMRNQLDAMKRDLDSLKAETVGDRNQIETFKRTLRGRIEQLEESAEELVSQTAFNALKGSVDGLSKTVENATSILNRAITAILASALGAFGLWLFNRLAGGG